MLKLVLELLFDLQTGSHDLHMQLITALSSRSHEQYHGGWMKIIHLCLRDHINNITVGGCKSFTFEGFRVSGQNLVLF